MNIFYEIVIVKMYRVKILKFKTYNTVFSIGT